MNDLRRQQLKKYWTLESKDELVMRIGTWNSEIISKFWDEKIFWYVKKKVFELTINQHRANEYLFKIMHWLEFSANMDFVSNYYAALVSSVLLPDYAFTWDDKDFEKEMDEIVNRSRAKERYNLKKDWFYHVQIWSEELLMDEIEKWGILPPNNFLVWWMFWRNRFVFDDSMLVYTATIPVRLTKWSTEIQEQESDEYKTKKPKEVSIKKEILQFEEVQEALEELLWPSRNWEFSIEDWKFMGFFLQTWMTSDDNLRYWEESKDTYFVIKFFHPEMTIWQDIIELKDLLGTMLDLNNWIINSLAKKFNYNNWKIYHIFSKTATLYVEKANETTDEKLYEKFKHMLVKVKTPIYFSEIGWQPKAKEELENLVLAFKHQEVLKAWATKTPSWILMEWPPWTWKTQLWVALASSINAEVYKIKLTDIMSNAYINNWAKNIAELFQFLRLRSKQEKRKIIVILEEMEAMFSQRWNDRSEDNKVVNTFLNEMNTCEEDENIIFIWTTNDMKAMDKAVLRSWRMTLKINVPLPKTDKDRREILDIHFNKAKKKGTRKLFSQDIDLDLISKNTAWFSWADIEEIFRSALIREAMAELKWADKDSLSVTTDDMLESIEEIRKTLWIKNPMWFWK